MNNHVKGSLKRYIDDKKTKYNSIVDTFVRMESPSIYGEPVTINKKSGKIVSGKSPNFKLIAQIEKIRKNV